MNGLYRARLRTIAARQLWDGRRPAPGRVAIPGIGEFQKGVRALRNAAASGSPAAAGRLAEIDTALAAGWRAMGRWRRGLAAVAAGPGPKTEAEDPHGRWLGATRLVAVRAPETRRLARLIVDYDALCAAAVALTARARRAGVFNAQQAGIREHGRRIRAVIHAGYAARAALRQRPGRRVVRRG